TTREHAAAPRHAATGNPPTRSARRLRRRITACKSKRQRDESKGSGGKFASSHETCSAPSGRKKFGPSSALCGRRTGPAPVLTGISRDHRGQKCPHRSARPHRTRQNVTLTVSLRRRCTKARETALPTSAPRRVRAFVRLLFCTPLQLLRRATRSHQRSTAASAAACAAVARSSARRARSSGG